MYDVVFAENFARTKHLGKLDRGGTPYIEHPIAVSGMVKSDLEKVVALLHDTVEDTYTTVDEVRELFGDVVADAVDCLTMRDGEDYIEYIIRVKGNDVARVVKMADLIHNMDLSRLPYVTNKDFMRVGKYRAAYDFLKA